ncbi:MAG: Holliday junction branch migration protein RuvA [Patescibacteria group bacterium]
MIGKLTGTIARFAPGEALVDVGGVGYLVRTPLSLTLSEGDAAALHIYTAVRDDAIDLYGFTAVEDIAFFKQLMTVSSIGPKTALTIMGVSDVGSLRRAIAQGDASVLVKVFGIGKKSAERIVVELREKVGGAEGAAMGEDGEVIEALMALGYTAHESRAALKKVSGTNVKEKIASALKNLGS